MRKLTKMILAAASLALVLGVAGQASAVTSIGLKLLSGGVEDCGAGCVTGTPSDSLFFAITMSIDSAGMTGYSFDLRWDTDLEDELDLTFSRFRGSLDLGPIGATSPPVFVGYNVGTTDPPVLSIVGFAGNIIKMSANAQSIEAPFAESISFRVGVVRFHVNGNLSPNGTSVELGFFDAPTNAFGDKFFLSDPLPNFGSFEVASVPEPGTSLLMGMGVLGLIMAGRASRKS